jgi:hypothetical protein
MGDAEGGEDQHQGEGEFLEPKGQAVRDARAAGGGTECVACDPVLASLTASLRLSSRSA